jgi:CheY-like chemotaxis protein
VNARDAMPHGGRLVLRTSQVDADSPLLRRREESRPGGHLCLEVQDQGEGMDRETRLRIFEPFFTTKRRGTGLGLATVFGRVKKAGGFVRVDSARGEGTTFRVFLPGVSDPVERVRRETPRRRLAGAKKRVLVVEDDDRVRSVTAAALERFGYSVVTAPDVRTALDLAGRPEGDVDLLLADLNLPDGSGPALARDYRALRPGTGLLFTSGYSDAELTRDMWDIGDMVFLPKPFSIDDLLEKVAEALERAAEAPERTAETRDGRRA